METKNKHKKRSIFLLFLYALIIFKSGMVIAFFSRFDLDLRAWDFQKMHPGVPFPHDLQMQLSFFQSWWYVHGVGLLLAFPLTHRLAKRLKFIKPLTATIITLLFWSIFEFAGYIGIPN